MKKLLYIPVIIFAAFVVPLIEWYEYRWTKHEAKGLKNNN